MYELKIVRLLEKMPIFSLADVSKITGSRDYSKKLLSRLIKKGVVKRIMRDKYSFHEKIGDAFLMAPFLYSPSYISCASALSYYGLITQIPTSVFLMTSKRPKIIKTETTIIYHKTKHFFGFRQTELNGFKIPIAEPEKAFIDSIKIHPLHMIINVLSELDHKKLFSYAKKTNEMKRVGYLLEKNNFEVEIPKELSSKYIYLDPLGSKKGRKDKKWKLIVNY